MYFRPHYCHFHLFQFYGNSHFNDSEFLCLGSNFSTFLLGTTSTLKKKTLDLTKKLLDLLFQNAVQ